jgi:putative DNA primase/helicase
MNPTSSIAIRCDSLTVIDLDGAVGIKAFRELRESHGAPPPETPTVLTGGGGYHLYFRGLSGVRNKVQLVRGVDVRAQGGYVIAPPSRNLKGDYRWLEGREPWTLPLTPLPGWLADLLVEPEEDKSPPGVHEHCDPWEPNLDAFQDIEDGTRNTNLVKVCGSLFNAYSGRDALPYHEVAGQVEKAMRIVNQRKVHPPVEDTEIALIVQKMVRRNERKRR